MFISVAAVRRKLWHVCKANATYSLGWSGQ